ncbi:MAG: ASCH domain-containing protein [Gaiellales bacterium]
MRPRSEPALDAHWADVRAVLGLPDEAPWTAMPFAEPDEAVGGFDPAAMDELADLAARSMKRGTCHLLEQFQRDGFALRRPGDHWTVLRADGTPACTVRLIGVDVLPFEQVDARFAALEGPEQGVAPTLGAWRRVHRAFFEGQCARWGIAFHPALDVVCESFITVHSPDHPIELPADDRWSAAADRS